MTVKLARTNAEAHLYMDMHPCEGCGESEFDMQSSVISLPEGLASRYTGSCPRCQRRRAFTFLLPEEIVFPDPDEPSFGDERPSELLDPGEWLWLADLLSRNVPAEPSDDDPARRRAALLDLRTAAAAISEVLKFLPDGADELDLDVFWSDRGRAVFGGEPGRFDRGRLEVVRTTYRDIADRFADRSV